MRRKLAIAIRTAAIVAVGSMTATMARAGETLVAVSPGSAEALARVGDTCPTFSWTALPGARRYDLVVYAVGEGETDSTEVLRRALPGGATSWTPSLEACLERGGRYAWSVRAVGSKGPSGWSAPSLFEVAARPSETEFEAAVEVVRSYLAVSKEDAEASEPVVGAIDSPDPAGAVSSGPPVALAPLAATQLTVDGNIDATSFTGDGSNLTGVGNPDGPCFEATRRFADCGNGTVTDTETGLIYLKNANCFGTQNWVTANQSATGLADGSCGLTDGSRQGDWRLQTKDEWEGILDPSCTFSPNIVGNQTTGGCYTDATDPASEWASGVLSDQYWSSTSSATPPFAAFADLFTGTTGSLIKTALRYVWPVRSGQ